MKRNYVLCYILVGIFYFSSAIYGQHIKSIISTKTGKHFIGVEIQPIVNKHLRIELYSKDSTFKSIIYDSTLIKRKKIKLILNSEFDSYKNKKKDDIIISLPPIESGFYFFRYTTPDTSFVRKFIYMK